MMDVCGCWWCNMSPNGAKSGGFNPPRMTPTQFQDLANFFKDYLADKPLVKWSIVAAGIGGALEGLHILWLALIWIVGRIR
jgi:hypothetical protein